MAQHFEGVLQTGAANTPVSLLAKLVAAGYTGSALLQRCHLRCMDADGENIAFGPATMTTEGDGAKLQPTDTYDYPAPVDATQVYIISAGVNKKFYVSCASL